MEGLATCNLPISVSIPPNKNYALGDLGDSLLSYR